MFPGKGYIPFEPWPFQQDFLRCRDRFRIINKPRQCGISTTEAAECAWEFDNIPGSRVVIISKDGDSAINFHKYVSDMLKSVRRKNPKVNFPKLLKTNTRLTENSIGSKIISLASSKEAGRSFSATHLVLDELAFIEYADDIWQSANATLSQTRGRVTAISTPKGRAGLFARIFETPGHMGFTTFSYGWWNVPTYNPLYEEMMAVYDDKLARLEIIDRAKKIPNSWYQQERRKYTDLAWRQEFEGAFDANKGSVFSTRSLEKVFVRNYLTQKEDADGIVDEWWTQPREDNHIYCTGIDLGRKNDPAVIVTFDITEMRARLVDFKYIEAGHSDWELIDRKVKEHLEFWDPEAMHDGTGVGDSLTESLYGMSEPFFFTKSSKNNMIIRMQHAFDHGAVMMPKIPVLYREHQRYQWDDKDIVQDTVMACGMAIWQFHDTDGVFVGFDKTVNFVESP